MNISKMKKTGTHAITATVLGLLTALPLQAEPFAYIPDYDGNISVIDTATNTEVDNILHGDPGSIEMHPSGHSFYIANRDDGVSAYDTASNTLIATIPTNGQPSDIAISAVTNLVYITSPDSVTVIDASTNNVIATIPMNKTPGNLVVSPDGSKVYAAHHGEITIIDSATHTVSGTLLNQGSVFDMVAHPTENLIYIASGHSINVIDTETDSEITKVATGANGYFIDISPDGSKVYTANYTSGSVSAMDTQTNSLIETILMDHYPFGIKVHPSGKSVYVPGFSFDASGPVTEVAIIETTTQTVSETINSLGYIPVDIVISPLQEDIGGNATGTQQLSVVCSNLTTSQQVTLSLGTATDWNCETAGLGASPGDQIQMNILGTAK